METDLDEQKGFQVRIAEGLRDYQIRIAEKFAADLEELKDELKSFKIRIAEELKNAHVELARLVEAFVRASGDGRRGRQ